MRNATLCFPVDLCDGKVEFLWLGMKRVRFGAGRWNGFGGKVEEGETVEAATVRELQEESFLIAKVEDLIPIARLMFRWPHKPKWNMNVYAFCVSDYTGNALQTEEMRPCRFDADSIPYEDMWPDDEVWLPYALRLDGFVRGAFTFTEDGKLAIWDVRYQRNQ